MGSRQRFEPCQRCDGDGKARVSQTFPDGSRESIEIGLCRSCEDLPRIPCPACDGTGWGKRCNCGTGGRWTGHELGCGMCEDCYGRGWIKPDRMFLIWWCESNFEGMIAARLEDGPTDLGECPVCMSRTENTPGCGWRMRPDPKPLKEWESPQ